MEVELFAQLMERFRQTCYDADIRPREWSGAGKISEALLKRERVFRKADLVATVPSDVLDMASAAYFGGRFEVFRIGEIPGPVYEYDLHSAYPSAYQHVPCLEHGRWIACTAKQLAGLPAGELWIGPVRFSHASDTRLNVCGLPIRQKTGRICWPVEGRGIYWSMEIEAARLLGATVRPTGPGWRYERHCECRPLGWVAGLYEHRKRLQCDDTLGGKIAGHPIKLGMNGCYGKFCQRIGAAPWGNLVWGGIITAWCRAQLMRAAATDPGAVVMMATDGLFTTRPLPVDIGDALGKWETTTHERLFVVQPGIYWGGVTRSKTRGIDPRFFANKTETGIPYTEIFETTWTEFGKQDRAATKVELSVPPGVTLPVELFTGLKLAYSRGKPETAGIWSEKPRRFDFDWSGKRSAGIWETDSCLWTFPQAGGRDVQSLPHKWDESEIAVRDLAREELEDQPDHFDMGPLK